MNCRRWVKDETGSKIGHRHFLGRMATLGIVPAWVELLKVYSSTDRAEKMENACKNLNESIIKVVEAMRELVPVNYPDDKPEILVPDNGWTSAYEKLLDEIKKGAQEELKEREGRCAAVVRQWMDVVCKCLEIVLKKAKIRLGL
jgi:hypothetical protein